MLRLAEALRQHKASVIKHDVFGALAVRDGVLTGLKRSLGKPDWPITWVQGRGCCKTGLAGMQVLAVSGNVDTIWQQNRPVARLYDDGAARHCFIGDLRPADLTATEPQQTQQLLSSLEATLLEAGMPLSSLVRTWFFLENILAWYNQFNEVRTEIYTQRNLFREGVPASTGVGARNPFGAALSAAAWAIEPSDSALDIRQIDSPLQCSASSYGSCFSRAIKLSTRQHEQLLVSGTASIAPDGRSACDGDLDGQVDLTMRVVESLLKAEGLGFADVSRATAYFKRIDDAAAFDRWQLTRKLKLPVLITEADICRDELWFEIELDAAAERRPQKLEGKHGTPQ